MLLMSFRLNKRLLSILCSAAGILVLAVALKTASAPAAARARLKTTLFRRNDGSAAFEMGQFQKQNTLASLDAAPGAPPKEARAAAGV